MQRTATLRVVANRQKYLTLQVTSVQQTDSGLIAVLQQTTTLRVVARPQANISPVAKSTCPCRQNTPRLGGNASHTSERREVRMIFEGPREVRDSLCERDRYSQKAKRPLQTVVHTTDSKPPRGYIPQPDDIVLPNPTQAGCTTPMKTP